jgi:hypothetical protein
VEAVVMAVRQIHQELQSSWLARALRQEVVEVEVGSDIAQARLRRIVKPTLQQRPSITTIPSMEHPALALRESSLFAT